MMPYSDLSSSSYMDYYNNCFDDLMKSKSYSYPPFDANIRNPIVYIMQPRNQKNNSKENKGGFFSKAFDWYTKERLAKGVSEDESMVGFASWLDMKYDEYQNHVTGKREKICSPGRSKSVEVILEPKDLMSRPASICQYHGATAGLKKSYVVMCSCKKLKSYNCLKAAQSDVGITNEECCHCKAKKPKKGTFLKAFREFGDKVQPISQHEYLPSCKHVNLPNNKQDNTEKQDYLPSCQIGCLKNPELQEYFPPCKPDCLKNPEVQEYFPPCKPDCLKNPELQEYFRPCKPDCLKNPGLQEHFPPCKPDCLKNPEVQEYFPQRKPGCLKNPELQEYFPQSKPGCLKNPELQEYFRPCKPDCSKNLEPQECFPQSKPSCLKNPEVQEYIPACNQGCLKNLQREFATCTVQTPIKLCRLNRAKKKAVNLQTSDLYIVVDEVNQSNPTFIKIAPPGKDYVNMDKK